MSEITRGRTIRSIREVNVYWTHADAELYGLAATAGKVAIVKVDNYGFDKGQYMFVAGGCDVNYCSESEERRILMVLSLFHSMVVRDCLDPNVVHDALLQVEEYRKGISFDCSGMEAEAKMSLGTT